MVRRLDRSICFLPLVVADVFPEIGRACFGQYSEHSTSSRRRVFGASQGTRIHQCSFQFMAAVESSTAVVQKYGFAVDVGSFIAVPKVLSY